MIIVNCLHQIRQVIWQCDTVTETECDGHIDTVTLQSTNIHSRDTVTVAAFEIIAYGLTISYMLADD